MAAQGWAIDAAADTITFVNAPAASAAIVVNKYDTSTYNATQIWAYGAWSDAYGWPREVEFFADRMVFASNVAQPQTLWFTKVGDYGNFGRSTPIADDDAITATINARQINTIRDLVPLTSLIVLTSGGEFQMTGGQDDVLTPSSVGVKPQSFNGVSEIPTQVVGNTGIYIQGRGNVVRDIGYQFEADGYVGNNLSIFSAHLLEGYTVVDAAYQQVPFSTVWLVRDDGVLLSLTYIKEQQIIGWARHDTRGFVESICCIPEGTEDALYMVVQREIGGQLKRYVERMQTRNQTDPLQPWFVDSALSIDGRNDYTVNNDRFTIHHDGITDWDEHTEWTLVGEPPTLFDGMGIGDEFYAESETTTWDEIQNRSVTTVTARTRLRLISTPAFGTVRALSVGKLPAAFLNVGIKKWTKRFDTFSGLDHLEGLDVVGVGDGFVLPRRTVVNGTVSYDTAYGVVVLGLPYYSDMETLDVNLLGGETVRSKQKVMSRVTLVVDASRNIKVGVDADHLHTTAPRDITTDFNDPVSPATDAFVVDVTDGWSMKGHVFVRQDEPLPLTILSVIPEVSIADTSGGR